MNWLFSKEKWPKKEFSWESLKNKKVSARKSIFFYNSIMHNLPLETTLPLLLLVGVFSSILASMIGLGGGLVAIPFISLVIGFDHSFQAKLIVYASVASLSLFAAFKYIRQKRKPDFKSAFFILIGTIPVTILCELFVSPKLSAIPKYVFTYCYGVIVIFVIALINFKHLIPFKGIAPT